MIKAFMQWIFFQKKWSILFVCFLEKYLAIHVVLSCLSIYDGIYLSIYLSIFLYMGACIDLLFDLSYLFTCFFCILFVFIVLSPGIFLIYVCGVLFIYISMIFWWVYVFMFFWMYQFNLCLHCFFFYVCVYFKCMQVSMYGFFLLIDLCFIYSLLSVLTDWLVYLLSLFICKEFAPCTMRSES